MEWDAWTVLIGCCLWVAAMVDNTSLAFGCFINKACEGFGGKELWDSENEHQLRIGDLFSDLAESVEGIGGGDDGAEGHDGETHNGEVERVGGKEEDDVAFADAEVGGEGGGDAGCVERSVAVVGRWWRRRCIFKKIGEGRARVGGGMGCVFQI
ncbi:hypothetical protein ACS0TY_002045 [Phlomoides rotata]